MIILKVTKTQSVNLSLEDTLFEIPQGDGGGGWGANCPTSVLGSKSWYSVIHRNPNDSALYKSFITLSLIKRSINLSTQ